MFRTTGGGGADRPSTDRYVLKSSVSSEPQDIEKVDFAPLAL
jgi:hypothetical protein